MADVSKIKLPNGTTYNIKDENALPLTGGSVTGPVSFGDSVSIDEATIGDLVVNGSASFTNNLQANTINGVEVGTTPNFTDTVTTVTTTGSGNAVTAITASNGALTVTKGTTFATGDTKVTQTAATASSYTYWRPLVIGMSAGSSAGFTPSTTTDTTYTFNTLEVQPSTGSIRVGNLVLYKGSYTATLTPETLTANRAITVPNKAGTIALTSDLPTVPSNIVNTITTTAGTHTAITSQTGSVSFNVPTKTSHLTNDSGFITSAGVTSITTTAGAHTAITSSTGAVSFKVPTTAAHVGAASSSHTHGNITNGGDITATAPTIASGDQIIINDHSASKITNGPTFDGSTTTTALTPKGTWESFAKSDTNTTYALSGALSSHKFTSTLTAGGSGSGTSTSDFTLAAGTGITITDDTSNRKMTIACSVTNTDKRLEVSEATSGIFYYPILSTGTTVAETRSQDTTGFSFLGVSGTGTASGTATFTLGNNSTGGSGKYGKLTIYSASQYGATIQTGSAFSADRTFNLPDKNGAIALTSDLNNYLQKPSSNNNFGWILCSDGSSTGTLWNPPETYTIGITEDDTTPGTYFLSCTPDEIRENFYSTYVLILNTYNQNTTTWTEHRLINYHMEDVYENNELVYQVLWFSGMKNYWDGTQIKTRRILCGIYLDSEEQYHTDGEVTVTITDNFAINGNVVIPNAQSYMAYNNTGDPRYLCGINASNQSVFGWGSYSAEEGASYFEGNEVYIQCKTGGIHINPNIAGLYKITTVTKTLSSGINANSYVAAANISMTAQSGFNAVGIVGSASSNFRIQPTTHYVLDNTHLFAGFANWTSSNVTSSTTVTFYVLWLKATSA